MTENMDRVIARIRKMLTLANDAGATEGERDNAMRMAHATLAKYNLDLAEIDSSGGKKTAGVEERHKLYTAFYGRPWARVVAQSVAELMFCKYLYIKASVAKQTVHVFVGSHANSVSASILAEFLVTSIIREGKRRTREADAGNAWFRSFATGAAASIARRCISLRESANRGDPADPATPGAPGTALVLAGVYEREAAANRAYVEQLNTRNEGRPHDFTRRTSSSALAEGVEYGSTVSLNRQVK